MRKIYAYLLLSAILYGSVSTVAKPSLVNIHPVFLSSLIYLVMGLTILFVNILTRSPIMSSKNSLGLIFLTGLFGGACGPILYFMGLNLTNASFAAILINTEFLFTVILAFFLLKEKITITIIAGIVCIFIGLLVLNYSENQAFANFQNQTFVGSLLIIISSLFWALDNNISKIVLVRGVSIRTLLQLKSLIGGSISLIVVLLLNISINFELYDVPILVFLSLGGFAGSVFLFMMGMKEVGAIKSVMILSTSSLFGVIFAILLLYEQVNLPELSTSLVFVVSGIFLITRDSK